MPRNEHTLIHEYANGIVPIHCGTPARTLLEIVQALIYKMVEIQKQIDALEVNDELD